MRLLKAGAGVAGRWHNILECMSSTLVLSQLKAFGSSHLNLVTTFQKTDASGITSEQERKAKRVQGYIPELVPLFHSSLFSLAPSDHGGIVGGWTRAIVKVLCAPTKSAVNALGDQNMTYEWIFGLRIEIAMETGVGLGQRVWNVSGVCPGLCLTIWLNKCENVLAKYVQKNLESVCNG